MAFAIEFSAESARDFELIFDHLFESSRGFGDGVEEALERAGLRVMGIRAAAGQLTLLPLRGIVRDDVLPGVRFIAIDRAIYWFDVDETRRRVRVLAVFLAGQDHVRRMLVRLLGEDVGRRGDRPTD